MLSGGKLTIETANVFLDETYASTHPDAVVGPHVLIAFTDDGVGIDAEMPKPMFEPFFTTKERGKGTGLGLSTVFGIVRQSGGHVSVSSEVASGTTFHVYFPRVEGGERAPSDAATRAPSRSLGAVTETILLVEDEELVRALTAKVLRLPGYRVLEAESGEAALRLGASAERFELLLTDVVMPRMNGRALAAQVVARRPEVKGLYMSGYTEREVVSHGILDAGIDFIEKPIAPRALVEKVRDVLEGT